MSWPRQRALSWRDLRAAPAQQQTHLWGGPDVLPCCQPPLLVSSVDTPLSPERIPAGSAPGVSLWRCAQALQASDRKMHQAEPVLYTFPPTAFVTPLWKPHLANSNLPFGSRRDERVLGVRLGQQNEDKFPHFYLFIFSSKHISSVYEGSNQIKQSFLPKYLPFYHPLRSDR